MTTDQDFSSLAPVILVAHDSSWSIIYSPGGPEYNAHRGALERHEVEGSGYDFSGALQAVLTDDAPEVLERVGFDPEAGMVSVYGTDLDALLIAATHLHRIITADADLDAALTRSAQLGFED